MIVEDEDGVSLTFRGGVCVNEDDLRAYARPMRVSKVFNTAAEADAFRAGIEYVGDPDVRVIDVELLGDGKATVLLEDASLRPEDDDPPEAPDMADDTPGEDAVE